MAAAAVRRRHQRNGGRRSDHHRPAGRQALPDNQGTGAGLADRTTALGRRIPDSVWNRASGLVSDRGGQAVFWGRFVPVVRTVVPHLTGAGDLPYRRIAPYSVAASVIWASAEAGTGFATAGAVATMPRIPGTALIIVGLAALAAALGLLLRRSRRRQRRPSPESRRAGSTAVEGMATCYQCGPTAISSPSVAPNWSSSRSPLQNRPGSYQFCGRSAASRPIAW